MEERLPLIVDIKRHSLEDGPGIRSVVFFKGCPLTCIFCHNPETQDPRFEISFSESDCMHCNACMDACPEGAINLNVKNRIDRKSCNRCGKCVDACPGFALKKIGTFYPVETLVEILLRDLPYYQHSNGGITLSGGECTLYPDYLNTLLRRLKSENIHISIQTAGEFVYETFKEMILPYADLIFFDLKIADPDTHFKYTGKTNHGIISNFKRLINEKTDEILPRIPLIPGITDTMDNLAGIVRILYESNAKNVTLLPYNPLGLGMHEKIGKSIPPISKGWMKPEDEAAAYALIKRLIDNHQNAPSQY